MTIREVQELVRFTDEKNGAKDAANSGTDDICTRFIEIVREANTAGVDLTEAFVNMIGQKKG